MGEKPRATLPAVERALAEARGLVAGNPTVEAARERLGDRIATDPDVGQALRVKSGLGVQHLGVVIFKKGAAVDVWLGAGRVQRLEDVSTAEPADEGELSPSLADIAASAIVFASLHEGQRVSYDNGGVLTSGLLVEKCRYGALVLGPDDAVMAVGFSQLTPMR
jgi:hypothetical protein